jgi:arylsulfatase A-like enzyme
VTSRGQWRNAVQGYLASINYCDHVVGEIVAALDASGSADNTAIVLWGDNGFHLGEKLHWRKFVLWEEATRVPLIFVPPGSRGGHARVHEPVSLVDIFPTILQLCAIPLPHSLDGESLLPLMSSPGYERSKPAIMTWGRGNHSIRTSQWRLARYVDGTEEPTHTSGRIWRTFQNSTPSGKNYPVGSLPTDPDYGRRIGDREYSILSHSCREATTSICAEIKNFVTH